LTDTANRVTETTTLPTITTGSTNPDLNAVAEVMRVEAAEAVTINLGEEVMKAGVEASIGKKSFLII
jgi:hypothetical protein